MPWRIDDRLYVSGIPSRKVVDDVGATAVVTVCSRTPAEEVRASLPVWYHLPLRDGKRLQTEEYRRAAELVTSLLDSGHTVLVHCVAGRNRSSLVAALVVQDRHRLTGDEALAWIRERRPRSLANAAFETWLQTGGEDHDL